MRYVGTDLYPEGVVECIPGDAYNVLADNTVEILEVRDGELENIGAISADRWASVLMVEPEGTCP